MTNIHYSYDMNNRIQEYYDHKRAEVAARRKLYEDSRAEARKQYNKERREEQNLRRRERYWRERAVGFFFDNHMEWRRCRAMEITYKAAADRFKFARQDSEEESLSQEYISTDGRNKEGTADTAAQ